MEVTVKRLVRHPLKEVFDFVADTRNDVKWAPLVEGVSQIAGDGPGVGSKYLYDQRMGKQVFPFEVEMVAFERPALLGWHGKSGKRSYSSNMVFAPHAKGTLVRQVNDAAYGRNWLERFIAKFIVKRTLRKQLRNVEKCLQADQS